MTALGLSPSWVCTRTLRKAFDWLKRDDSFLSFSAEFCSVRDLTIYLLLGIARTCTRSTSEKSAVARSVYR